MPAGATGSAGRRADASARLVPHAVATLAVGFRRIGHASRQILTSMTRSGRDRAHLAIEFMTNGRLYVRSGRTESEFIIVFGSLVSGPTRPAAATLVTAFFADVVLPNDSDPLLFQAHLDFSLPQEPETERRVGCALWRPDQTVVRPCMHPWR